MEQLINEVKNEFVQELAHLESKYTDMITHLIEYIVNLDYFVCGAWLANYHGYTQPTIQAHSTSFFKANALRHAVIERGRRTQSRRETRSRPWRGQSKSRYPAGGGESWSGRGHFRRPWSSA